MHAYSGGTLTAQEQLAVKEKFPSNNRIEVNNAQLFVEENTGYEHNSVLLQSLGQDCYSDHDNQYIDFQDIFDFNPATDAELQRNLPNQEMFSARGYSGETKSQSSGQYTFNSDVITYIPLSSHPPQGQNVSQQKIYTQISGTSHYDDFTDLCEIQPTAETLNGQYKNSNTEQAYNSISNKSLASFSGSENDSINDSEVDLNHTSFHSPLTPLIESLLDATQEPQDIQNSFDIQPDISIQDNGENPPSYKDPFPYSCESEDVQSQIRVFLIRVNLLSKSIAFRVSTGSFVFVRLAMDFKS